MSGTTPPPGAPAAPIPVPAAPLDKPTVPQPAAPPAGTGPPTTELSKAQARYNAKQYSEYYDPCQEAADRSWKCLKRNPGDKEMCSEYFQ